MKVVGIILMGGQNSRMNGEKKALLKYQDKYFYQCVSDAMTKAGVQDIYASVEKTWDFLIGFPQVVDSYRQIGPLGGIVTALKKFVEEEQMTEGILVVPCDLPRISDELLKKLLNKFQETKLPVVLMCDGWPNPLVAIYTKACLPVLEMQIAEGNYRAMQWTKQVEHAKIELATEEQYLISNVNTKEDYAALIS